jgi:hypothetical protein
MINIRIYNCPDKKERAKVRKAAMYFIEQLMPNKRRLDIRIFIKKDLLKNEKMSGSCTTEDFDVNKRHYDFTIHIDDALNFKDRLSILAHELTHVKQYATGQLQFDSKNPHMSIWEGKKYDETKIPYDKQPWEKDAVKHEVSLLKSLNKIEKWF